MKCQQKNRFLFVDAGKLIGISGVIVLHSCLGSYYLWSKSDSFNYFFCLLFYTASRFCVPLFVMLSAVTIIWRKYPTDITPSDSLTRIIKMLLPVCVWSIFYMSLSSSLSLEKVVSIIYSPQGVSHLWFIYMLWGLYILSPIVSYIVNRCNRGGYYISLLFGLSFHL